MAYPHIKYDVTVLHYAFKSSKRHRKCFNVKCTKGTPIKMSLPETSLCTYAFSSSIF